MYEISMQIFFLEITSKVADTIYAYVTQNLFALIGLVVVV